MAEPLTVGSIGEPRPKFTLTLEEFTAIGVVLVSIREWGEDREEVALSRTEATAVRDWLDVYLNGEPRDG